ncbi:hypothetical protein ACFW91_35640 [Streptomyces asoensis]|uniref:hypothetical protein n=1 Tax=Streptomyces asoensis TaxID=249586 RepID=UPI00368B2A71
MRTRAVVGRGARFGLLVGAWPAGIAGVLCLVAAFVFLVGGLRGTAYALALAAGRAVLGGLAAGVTVGTATGLALALAPRWLLVRPSLRALLAALVAGAPVAGLGVLSLTGDGYTLASYPPSIHVVVWSATSVVALVAAARSEDIAGCGAADDPGPRTGTGHRSGAG